MGFVLATARKDIRRRLRDPVALLLWVGIPLAIAGTILLAFGGSSSGPPKARLLVADEDGGAVSLLLLGALGQAPVVEAEQVTAEEGRARIEAGGASAFLRIPKGFGDAVLRGKPATLRLVTNPAQRILPGIVEEGLSILVDAVFYLQRLMKEPLDLIRESVGGTGPPSDRTVADISVLINHLVERLRGLLFPPAIQLEVAVEAEGAAVQAAPQRGLGSYFFPGILFMSVLFMASGLSADLWREKETGTLRRALASPHGPAALLAGKTLAGAAVIAGVCAAAVAGGCWAFDLGWAHAPLAVVWAAFAGTVFLVLMSLVKIHASSARTADLLVTFVLFPLLIVGGSFFPFAAMPEWLARIGKWTPNGWAVARLDDILAGTAAPGPLLLAFLGLAATGAVAFLLAARRLGRGFAGR